MNSNAVVPAESLRLPKEPLILPAGIIVVLFVVLWTIRVSL